MWAGEQNPARDTIQALLATLWCSFAWGDAASGDFRSALVDLVVASLYTTFLTARLVQRWRREAKAR